MKKVRVAGFFVLLLVFAVLLTLLQLLRFGGLSSFVISEHYQEEVQSNEFLVNILDAQQIRRLVWINYEIQELKGIDQHLDVEMGVQDASGNLLAEIKERVLLKANTREVFSSESEVPYGENVLQIEMRLNNGRSQSSITKEVNVAQGITGFSIFEENRERNILLLVISILLGVIIIKTLFRQHQKMRSIGNNPLRKRNIDLDLEEFK